MYMVMDSYYNKWLGQIRRGYLELCIFALIKQLKKTYGFEIISNMEKLGLLIKEGTLYPILNRMTKEGHLVASWDLQNVQGHPRKFYSLTAQGEELFARMKEEFGSMNETFHEIKNINDILKAETELKGEAQEGEENEDAESN